MPFFHRTTKRESPKPDDLVVITTAENQVAADMTLGILRTHQIPCMARPRGIGVAYLGLALQPHHILVRATDRERAEEVLHAFSDADDVKLLWR